MLIKLLKKLRGKRELTPEDLAADEEAKEMRYDMETLRTSGGGRGPSFYSHGGKESRGR